MTQIHPAHLKGNLAVSSLRQNLAQIGILADEIKNDYGEDLILQTNLENIADSFAIRIQVKYTEFTKNRKGNYSVRFSIDHLWRWISHADPVFVCLYDPSINRFALINPKTYFSLWKISTTKQNSLVVNFSDADIAVDNAALEKCVWDARISYYSAKIAELESRGYYAPILDKVDRKKYSDDLLLEMGVIIFAFMRAVGILRGGRFTPSYLRYVFNAGHNLAKDGFEDLRAAFMLALHARVSDVAKVGLPFNLGERTTDLCGHYYRHIKPKEWRTLNALYAKRWNPFGIGSGKSHRKQRSKSRIRTAKSPTNS